MKKNALQKVLVTALVGAMAMGTLAGCGNSGKSGDRVTLKIPVYDRGDSNNGCSNVEDNYWTQWVQENFGDPNNIDVQYVAIGRNTVMTDYAQLVSVGELPTILMEYDYDKLATWQAEGYLQSYDIEKLVSIAPTYYKNMVDNGLDAYTKLDGKDYLALGMRPYGNTNYTWVTWYRQDWLDQIGAQYPQTASERLDVYQKLVDAGITAHPAGGTKIAGAGVDQNYGWRDIPQDELTWATTGDYQVPALSTEAQKRFLKFENELYNRGFKDPEYMFKETSQAESDFINGVSFEWGGYTSSTMTQLQSFYETNPNGKLGVVVCSGVPVLDPVWGSTNAFRPNNVFGAMTAFSKDATEAEVEAAMKYMEWMSQEDNLFTMTWGIEGVNFNYVDGNPVAVGDQSGLAEQQGHNNNVDYWMIVTAAKTFGNIEKDIAAISPQGLPQDFYEDILANYYGQNRLYNVGAFSDCNFATSFQSVNDYGATLYNDVYPVYRDQLTTCKPEEFDALYDQLSKEYLEKGYQAIIDEKRAAYEAGLSTHLP